MDAKYLHGTAHEFVQAFAVSADGWFFETDEDATRHDRELERLIEQRDIGLLTALINTAPTRGSNAVLVPADQLKELQDKVRQLETEKAGAIKLYEDSEASHCADLRIGIDAAVESYRRDVEAGLARERELRAWLKTAATFLSCAPDAVDDALVRDYGMISQEDTRSLIALIHVLLDRPQ